MLLTESPLLNGFGCKGELEALRVPYIPLSEVAAEVWPNTVRRTEINGVLVIGRPVNPDQRGDFHETYRKSEIIKAMGFFPDFCQGNESRNIEAKVLRGLHIAPWWKMVTCTAGEAFVVVVDARPDSPSFGKVVGQTLDSANRLTIIVSPGCAHGYLTLVPGTTYAYQATEEWTKGREKGISYADPDLKISFPLEGPFSVSDQDANNPRLKQLFEGQVDFSSYPWLQG